jgi:glutamate/tyrosine decarboxylase-like PLP-dependent enzyme
MDLARYAEQLLEANPKIEVVSRAVLSVVSFRYVPSPELDEETIERVNQEIRQRVWDSGKAMITSSRAGGRYVLRIAVVNHNTRRSDVEETIRLIEELGATVCSD